MNRVFRRGPGNRVPDGTMVYPYLNPTDSTNDLPVGLFDGVSMALGEILPEQTSKIQVHPLVTVVIWVISGRLNLKMKDREQPAAYLVELGPEDGAVALPGTFFQLINRQTEVCRVLYVVSPPYVFLQSADGKVHFDDAIVLDADWETLADQQWRPPSLQDLDQMTVERQNAIKELARRKRAVM